MNRERVEELKTMLSQICDAAYGSRPRPPQLSVSGEKTELFIYDKPVRWIFEALDQLIDKPKTGCEPSKPLPVICHECAKIGCPLLPIRKGDAWTCSEFNPINVIATDTAGTKFDSGKPSISLLHRSFVEGTAQVMTFGKTRYGLHNWCRGIAYSRLIDAAMRHLIAFNSGEDIDKDSGLPHIHCAAANLNMLSGMVELHPELDDRYRP